MAKQAVEFYRKTDDSKIVNYALTISENGRILSSTTNRSRASLFDEKLIEKAKSFYNEEKAIVLV